MENQARILQWTRERIKILSEKLSEKGLYFTSRSLNDWHSYKNMVIPGEHEMDERDLGAALEALSELGEVDRIRVHTGTYGKEDNRVWRVVQAYRIKQ